MPMTAEAMRKGSTPRSMSLNRTPMVSLACIEDSIRCPVRAAWTAMFGRLGVTDFAHQDDILLKVGIIPQRLGDQKSPVFIDLTIDPARIKKSEEGSRILVQRGGPGGGTMKHSQMDYFAVRGALVKWGEIF
jgi:hypothetical protein